MRSRHRVEIKIPTVTCVRCGYTWVPRKQPRACPKCKSDPLHKGPGKGWKGGKHKTKTGWRTVSAEPVLASKRPAAATIPK